MPITITFPFLVLENSVLKSSLMQPMQDFDPKGSDPIGIHVHMYFNYGTHSEENHCFLNFLMYNFGPQAKGSGHIGSRTFVCFKWW